MIEACRRTAQSGPVVGEHPVIPLFPLPLVVCPGEPLLLHVFEARYRQLIQDCRAAQQLGQFDEFGILYASGERRAPVGTTVCIERVLKEYKDGRSEILALGRRRFRAERLVQGERPYEEAEVAFLPLEDTDWDEKLANRVFRLHRTLFKAVTGEQLPDVVYSGRTSLALFMAHHSGLPAERKQQLLELDRENDRLGLLAEYLQEAVPQLRRVEAMREQIQSGWILHQFLTSTGEDEIGD